MHENCLNVSLVFYETFKNERKCKTKIKIFIELLEFLEDDITINEILVIDNSPLNKIKKYFSNFKKVKYVFVNKNIGFSKGHNLSKKYLSKSKYHLILNPDIVFEDNNLLVKLINFMDLNKNVAMVQPLIYGYPENKIQHLCKKDPTLLIQIIRGFLKKYINKFSFFYNYNFKYEMREVAYSNKIVESTYLSGAFMFCRTALLNKVNWFDEIFFMYLEDADITRRLSKHGKCVQNPFLKVRHVWARGSHSNKYLKLIACISFIKYSFKWGLKLY